MSANNKDLVRRMITWWTIGDVAVIDETNAPEFVLQPLVESRQTGGMVIKLCSHRS